MVCTLSGHQTWQKLGGGWGRSALRWRTAKERVGEKPSWQSKSPFSGGPWIINSFSFVCLKISLLFFITQTVVWLNITV